MSNPIEQTTGHWHSVITIFLFFLRAVGENVLATISIGASDHVGASVAGEIPMRWRVVRTENSSRGEMVTSKTAATINIQTVIQQINSSMYNCKKSLLLSLKRLSPPISAWTTSTTSEEVMTR